MALTISNQGSAKSGTTGTTLDVTTNTASIGDYLLVVVAADNAGTVSPGESSITTVTDTGSNTYTKRGETNRDPGAAAAGCTLAFFTAPITAALSAATITVNFSPTTIRRLAHVYRIQPGASDVVAIRSTGAGANGSSTTPSITATGVTSGDTIFGGMAAETDDAITTDSDTTNGNWSTLVTDLQDDGADAVTMRIHSQWKTTTGTGDQTFNLGIAGAQDWAVNWITLYPAKKVVADAGSYAVTGTAATLKRTYITTAAAGAYAVTGADAVRTFGILVSAGSYVVTGTDATLSKTTVKQIVADPGSYSVTGTAATLARQLKTIPDPGSYAVTGTAATLARQLKTVPDAGSYSVTGTNATFARTYIATAGSGAYTITGTAATLKRALLLTADAGSYSVTGTDAALRRALKITAGAGSYSLTGTDATLVYTPVGGYTLSISGGSYAVAGANASLLHGWTVSANSGAYAVTGADAVRTFGLIVSAGSYSVTGTDATLVYTPVGGYTLSISGGSYAVTGSDATLSKTTVATTGAGGHGRRYDFLDRPRFQEPPQKATAKQKRQAASQVIRSGQSLSGPLLDAQKQALAQAAQAELEARNLRADMAEIEAMIERRYGEILDANYRNKINDDAMTLLLLAS